MIKTVIVLLSITLIVVLALYVNIARGAVNPAFDFHFGILGSGNGQLKAPNGIALDVAGNIYVADTNNNRIQKFNSAGTYVSKFGESGPGNGQLNVPQGVFVDAYNNIMVSDTGNHRIQKFDSSGNFVLSFGTFGTG